MSLTLGTTVPSKGCITRLIDVVNREPAFLEDLVGFHRGRLAQGFYFLLLTQAFGPGEFEFHGYTHMSGGKIGLPSNNPAIEGARPSVHGNLLNQFGARDTGGLMKNFCSTIRLKGPDRYVKILPAVQHDPAMGAADQYPASKLSIRQVNLRVAKPFLVAAEVRGTMWSLANGARIDVGARPRYDKPYDADPRKRVQDYLANA